MEQAIQERLAASGIQVVAETVSHCLFTRDNFIGLVTRTGDGFGSVGSTGMLTANGLAYLVWHDGQPFLKSKTAESPAADAQVDAIRQFSRDLETALR